MKRWYLKVNAVFFQGIQRIMIFISTFDSVISTQITGAENFLLGKKDS